MKYLRKFETESEAQMREKPNVSLIKTSYDNKTEIAFSRALGVFIQHINGTLYTKEEWVNGGFSSADANGVAYCTLKVAFVISKEELPATTWSSDTTNVVEGVIEETQSTLKVASDFYGVENTAKILKTDVSGAAYCCANYTFPNGQKGYLGGAGEWLQLSKRFNDMNEAMLLIGATLKSKDYWTSTQYAGAGACYAAHGGYEGKYMIQAGEPKSQNVAVRPFTTLNF